MEEVGDFIKREITREVSKRFLPKGCGGCALILLILVIIVCLLIIYWPKSELQIINVCPDITEVYVQLNNEKEVKYEFIEFEFSEDLPYFLTYVNNFSKGDVVKIRYMYFRNEKIYEEELDDSFEWEYTFIIDENGNGKF